jgi:hypothetical protein
LPTSVQFLEPERIVESVYAGVVGPVEFERSVERAIALARSRASFRFLSDLTALAKGPSPGDLFAMVRMLESRDLPRTLREALVVTPDFPDPGDARFYEDTCRNRGWDIRIFLDRTSALAWLESDPAPGTVPARSD